MTSASSTQLTCLCGAIKAPGILLSVSDIPIHMEICHCNSCRYTTGALAACFPTLKSAPSQDNLSNLTGYKSSEFLTRYFCSTCGCHCFVLSLSEKQWYCTSGIIEQNPALASNLPRPEDIVKISRHDYVLDTVDGGLAPLLLDINGISIPTWSAASKDDSEKDGFDLPHATILDLPRKSMSTLLPPEENSYLSAKCHCGGVSLQIKRANYTSKSSERYIPSDPTKYLAFLCACRSCRLSTGVSLTPWTLIPPANVFNANAPISSNGLMPVVFGQDASHPDANPGLALRHHWSSPDVCRSFCGKCGATVSYWCSQRPDELDFAVGILRGEEGTMARRWLEWEWGRCSFTEESIDKEMCEAWVNSSELMKRIEP